MGNNKNLRIVFNCQKCGKEHSDRPSHYARKKKHYCSMNCYALDRKENWEKSEMPTWKGGVSSYDAHRKYVVNNPERISHLKSRAYARKRDAEGSHTLLEWNELKVKFNNLCAICYEPKKLTKDHIIPLSKEGSDYISNIQPLCRNCNSKKYNKLNYIHENPELLK